MKALQIMFTWALLCSLSKVYAQVNDQIDALQTMRVTYGGPTNQRALRFESPNGSIKSAVNIRLQDRFLG
jgi:hypothetical protein